MKDDDYTSINGVLDKMLQLKDKEKKTSFYQISLCVFGVLAGLVVIVFLCIMIYKNNFSMENLLSLLLAFFSIFISVFFYFKASDTSNKFYDNSYSFMKDISVTLGKIEERFGEKLNNLNDKISHISAEKEVKSEELQSTEDEKQAIINELIEKSKLKEEEKENFKNRLRKKEIEADLLKQQLIRLDIDYKKLRSINNEVPERFLNNRIFNLLDQLSIEELENIYNWEDVKPITLMKIKRMGIDIEYLINNNEFRSLLRKKLENIREMSKQ
jgi:hypothetical protein